MAWRVFHLCVLISSQLNSLVDIPAELCSFHSIQLNSLQYSVWQILLSRAPPVLLSHVRETAARVSLSPVSLPEHSLRIES